MAIRFDTKLLRRERKAEAEAVAKITGLGYCQWDPEEAGLLIEASESEE